MFLGVDRVRWIMQYELYRGDCFDLGPDCDVTIVICASGFRHYLLCISTKQLNNRQHTKSYLRRRRLPPIPTLFDSLHPF